MKTRKVSFKCDCPDCKPARIIPCDKYIEGCNHPQCNEPMSEASHTPTPCKDSIPFVAADKATIRNTKGQLIAEVWAAEDRDFIVKAVNAHQEMLACLKHAAQSMTPKVWAILADSERKWQKRTLQAIAKATGGK